MAAAEAADLEGVREAVGEDEAEMDARIAAIMHLQQLQHKQEVMQLLEAHPVTNADTEFRLQLEELVRDHLNTCMALASCSTSHDNSPHAPTFGPLRGDSSESRHHLLDHSPDQCHHHHHHHHQYLLVDGEERVDVEEDRLGRQQQLSGETADDLGVSRGLLRPQSNILGRWDERQGTEPTLRERQVREAELLALASLHTVSTLDASFLQPPPQPCARNRTEENVSVQRPQRPQNSLFQMWRELEGERERERQQLSERPRIRGAESEEVQMWEEFEREHEEADLHRNPQSDGTSAQTEAVISENNLQMWQDNQDVIGAEMEQSILIEPSRIESTIQDASNNAQVSEMDGNQNETQEVDGERERVRQIVRRWMRESGVADSEAGSNTRPSSRTEWLREDERERVREMAREWVRVSNFESRDASPQRQDTPSSSPPRPAPVHQARVDSSSPGDTVPDQRSLDAERQRRMILELLMRSEQERQRELEGLSEHRTVSEFAHRNRLQNLLRGRFLRNGVTADEDRPPSSAAGEIGQLRQRRAVSGLREGFRFRLETIVRGQANPQQNDAQRRRLPNQQVVSTATVPPRVAPRVERPVRRHWPAVGAARRASELQSLEDATAYNMELRELLGRRSVTTMLASEFRDRLDQLIRSFIHRQGRTPQPWNIGRPAQPAANQQEQAQQRQVDGDVRDNAAQAVPMFVPPPPPPPPLPLWLREPQTAAWPRPPMRAGELEWESTSRSLKADVAVLQRGMGELREMMDTCIQMQLELQRSIRQEVSGALQRMYIGKAIPDEALDGAKWTSVKRGTCCICCDKPIDSLLYRCGHMCTCLTCAMELHQKSDRCPMCRAAIVEVVRAFTVT
ncbi:hypothetical protein Mapa_009044 [Marchantia paleacea]|nr:hypothetical protein Mapa_009044 [Marchantia paleacea]